MSSIKCLNKYWVENPAQLFCRYYDILPLSGATIENQFNALTRFIIIISIIVMFFQFDQGAFLLLSSFIIITVIYYVERYFTNNTSEFNQTCTNCIIENFEPDSVPELRENYEFDNHTYQPMWMQHKIPPVPTLAPRTVYNPNISQVAVNSMRYPNSGRFCDKEIDMNFTQGADNQNFLSNNQALAMQGTSVVHERTKIPPVIVPPPNDPEWFVNNLYVRSCVNGDSPMDPNLSGYNLQNAQPGAPRSSLVEYPIPVNHQLGRNPIVNYQSPGVIIEPFSSGHASPSISYKLQHSAGPETNMYAQSNDLMRERLNFGKTLDAPIYNPSQLQNYLPSNANAGPLPRSGILNDFNKNLITQSLQPGIYSRNAIIEPTSSNIGISFTQQLQPRTDSITHQGGVMYNRHDGRVFKSEPSRQTSGCAAPDDVYDPRQSGYGTAYRAYVDPFSGSAKMYYDDVDDVRRPKFIARSNVDMLTPEQSTNFFNVDNSFRSMTENHRMDISERAMEKINNNNYYKRLAPISRAAPYNFKS